MIWVGQKGAKKEKESRVDFFQVKQNFAEQNNGLLSSLKEQNCRELLDTEHLFSSGGRARK